MSHFMHTSLERFISLKCYYILNILQEFIHQMSSHCSVSHRSHNSHLLIKISWLCLYPLGRRNTSPEDSVFPRAQSRSVREEIFYILIIEKLWEEISMITLTWEIILEKLPYSWLLGMALYKRCHTPRWL